MISFPFSHIIIFTLPAIVRMSLSYLTISLLLSEIKIAVFVVM